METDNLLCDIESDLISELEDLNGKIWRLQYFINTGEYDLEGIYGTIITPELLKLMREQLEAMKNYAHALSDRIVVVQGYSGKYDKVVPDAE